MRSTDPSNTLRITVVTRIVSGEVGIPEGDQDKLTLKLTPAQAVELIAHVSRQMKQNYEAETPDAGVVITVMGHGRPVHPATMLAQEMMRLRSTK